MPSLAMVLAASDTRVSGGQLTGGRRTSDPTRMRPLSGSSGLRARRMRRARLICKNPTPDGLARTALAASRSRR
jgi:hypothetical protein